jgi:protein TonB
VAELRLVRPVRFLALALIVMTPAMARQTQAADPLPPVNAWAGSPLPPKQMQGSGHSLECDVPPKFISGAAPIYPISRLRLREPGYAEIRFTVDETGHTRDFQVLKTNYPYFASHAIAAMRGWRFQPGTKHGRPVSCHNNRVPFTYRIGTPKGLTNR